MNIDNEKTLPIEARQARAILELSKLVEEAATLDEATKGCEQKLGEMIQNHELPNNQDEVQPVHEAVSAKIRAKFFDILNVDMVPFVELGRVQAEAGKFTEATETYRKALKMRPDLDELWQGLADVYFADGKLIEAFQIYQKLINNPGVKFETTKKYITTLVRLIKLNKKNINIALDQVDFLIKKKSELSYASFLLASDLRVYGYLEEALMLFLRIIGSKEASERTKKTAELIVKDIQKQILEAK